MSVCKTNMIKVATLQCFWVTELAWQGKCIVSKCQSKCQLLSSVFDVLKPFYAFSQQYNEFGQKCYAHFRGKVLTERLYDFPKIF